MLDIGWSELLVVAVVAIVVVGPKDLPKLMRNVGFYVGKLRRAASDFQRQFNEAMVESEAEEIRKNIEAIRGGMGGTVDMGSLDKPVMMPQTAPARHATETEAPKPEKPKRAPRAKTVRAKALRAKRPAPKPKTARAKSSGNKTTRAKTTRAKTSVSKRAPTKPRKAKVVAKQPAKPAAKRRAKAPVKAPVKARRKP